MIETIISRAFGRLPTQNRQKCCEVESAIGVGGETSTATPTSRHLCVCRTRSDSFDDRSASVRQQSLAGVKNDANLVTISNGVLLQVPVVNKKVRSHSWDSSILSTKQLRQIVSLFRFSSKENVHHLIDSDDSGGIELNYCVHCKCEEEWSKLCAMERVLGEKLYESGNNNNYAPVIVVSGPRSLTATTSSDNDSLDREEVVEGGRGSSNVSLSDNYYSTSAAIESDGERSELLQKYHHFSLLNIESSSVEEVTSSESDLYSPNIYLRSSAGFSDQNNSTSTTAATVLPSLSHSSSPSNEQKPQMPRGNETNSFLLQPRKKHGTHNSFYSSILSMAFNSSPIVDHQLPLLGTSAEPSDLSADVFVVNKKRATSVDVSCLLREIEYLQLPKSSQTPDFGQTQSSRSRSVDTGTTCKKISAWPWKRFLIPTILRKVLGRSSPAIYRSNARLDLFASMAEDKTKYWSECALPGDHIWMEASSSGDCYVKESSCVKAGERRKCAACHVVVHSACLSELNKMNFKCKPTFREAVNKFQKDQVTPVHHHWVHKKRQDGHCKRCARSFQQKFFNKEVVAIACSWCKSAYHNRHGCFTISQLEERCSLGPLSHLLVPPNWIVKLPLRKESTIKKRSISVSGLSTVGNLTSKRKRRSKKERLFVVRPPPPVLNQITSFGNTNLPSPEPRCPLLVFVNSKSGGNKGAKVMNTLCWLLNPRQIFDINAMIGPKYGLEMYRKVAGLRVLVCGGDGTIGWIYDTLDQLRWPSYPPIGILPLGTGNDLARTLGWGGSYNEEPISKLLTAIADEAVVACLDRWKVEIEPNQIADWSPEDEQDGEVCSTLPQSVINNYFSIGADAKIALEFHETRAANPEIFSSRFRNRLFYGGIGTKDLFKRTWRDLSEYISLECDGVNLTPKIQELKLHCLLILNIPRYAGGTLPWGPPDRTTAFSPPSFSDGKVEVIGLTATTMATLQMGGHGERLAQAANVRIVMVKPIPVQVDGEPCRLAPSKISIRLHNQVRVLQRVSIKNNARRGSSLPVLSTEPSSFNQVPSSAAPLYSSVLLNLPVAMVTRFNYDQYRYQPELLTQKSIPLVEIIVESEADLESARRILERQLHQVQPSLRPNRDWCFLDYVSSARVYRIDKAQEALHSISDVCATDDTLLILDSAIHATNDSSSPLDGYHSDSALSLVSVAPVEFKCSPNRISLDEREMSKHDDD